ncbi:MAG TPA: ethanolamine ammonia-lyase subunit EutC [Terracidiphilus sp.]|jgi:ethanolamine ammonia-lyase small subunit
MSAELAQQVIAARLRTLTPARVGLGRVGVSVETRDVLDFQLAHARARDAVHARLDASALAAEIESGIRPEVLRLQSAATDRTEYLLRPDLGRRLNGASRALLEEHGIDSTDVAIILADGLSALAVERHVPALLAELLPRLASLRLAPICIVEQGRVAIGDEVGEVLNAQLAVVLIGERPGLSSPDSLGAYITWMPRVGRTDAGRICISNIHTEGLGYVQAAEQLERVINDARRNQLTGVAPRAIAAASGEEN